MEGNQLASTTSETINGERGSDPIVAILVYRSMMSSVTEFPEKMKSSKNEIFSIST